MKNTNKQVFKNIAMAHSTDPMFFFFSMYEIFVKAILRIIYRLSVYIHKSKDSKLFL